MAEPEAVRLQGPSFTCGTTTSTNFPHRRHYAVRRKLGRAKTARLTAPQPSTDTVDEDDGPASTVTKDETTDDDAKCHSNLNDSTECDDDEESDGVGSNVENLEEEEEEGPLSFFTHFVCVSHCSFLKIPFPSPHCSFG